MKKIIFILFLCKVFYTGVFCQTFPRDTVIYDSENKYIVYNEDIYTFKEYRSMYSLMKDTSLIKKEINRFSFDFYHFDIPLKTLFFSYNSGGSSYLYSFDFANNKFSTLKKIEYSQIKYIEGEKLYYLQNDEIIIEGLFTNELINRTSINELLNEESCIPFELLAFSGNDNLFIGEGFEEDGAILGVDYHRIHKESLKLQQTNSLDASLDYLKNYDTETPLFLKMYSPNLEYAFIDTLILNSDYTLFSPFLELNISIAGFILNDREMTGYLVFTEMDGQNGTSTIDNVIINYSAKPELEKVMYTLYNNFGISKKILENLDKFDLNLLQNMIYAKHNKAFSDEYLNAYFNLYSFYRYKKDSRLDNVDNLLTDTDKQNLKLIQSAIKKLE
jgi:hypothetical protein